MEIYTYIYSNRQRIAVPPLPAEVHHHDVLGGRGGITNFHYGNLLFRELIRTILFVFDLGHPHQLVRSKRRLATAILYGMLTLFGTTFWRGLERTADRTAYLPPTPMDVDEAIRRIMQRFRENQQRRNNVVNADIHRDVRRMWAYLFDDQFPEVGEQIQEWNHNNNNNNNNNNARLLFLS